MTDNKNSEGKSSQVPETKKTSPEDKTNIPASARKPGQNYSTTKFKKK